MLNGDKRQGNNMTEYSLLRSLDDSALPDVDHEGRGQSCLHQNLDSEAHMQGKVVMD